MTPDDGADPHAADERRHDLVTLLGATGMLMTAAACGAIVQVAWIYQSFGPGLGAAPILDRLLANLVRYTREGFSSTVSR